MSQPSDYNNLSVRIPLAGGKSVGVSVKAKKQIPPEVVERAIQQLGATFVKEREELILQDWDATSKNITYEKDKTLQRAILHDHPQALPFEIVKVEPVAKKDFWTEYKRGFNFNPLWCILWLFWGLISVALDIHREKKESFGKLDLVFDCPLEQMPEAAIEVLRTTQDVAGKELQDGPGKTRAIQTLTGAIQNAEALLQCARGKMKLKDFADQIANNINSATVDNPIVIPAGFYEKEQYHPVHVVLFTKNSELTVRIFRLDIPTTAKIAPYEEYTLASPKLESFLRTLVRRQKYVPPTQLTKEQKGRHGFIKKHGLQSKESPTRTLEKEDPISRSLIELGAKEKPLPDNLKLRTPSKDPWKLSSVLMEESVQNLPKIERDRFILNLMQAHIKRMLPFADDLSAEKRKKYFKGLEKQIEQYEAKLSKKYSESFARNATKEIRETISSYLEESEVERQEKRQEIQEKKLSKATAETHIELHFQEPVRSLQTAVRSQEDLSSEMPTGIGGKLNVLKKIDELFQKPSLTKTDVDAVIKNMGECVDLADGLLTQGEFRKASQAASAILRLLPPYSTAMDVLIKENPSIGSIEDDTALQYFDPLYHKFGGVDYDDYEDLLRLETQVGLAVRILGESQLRSSSPLMPEDFVYLQNARAFLAQIQQRKKAILLLRMFVIFNDASTIFDRIQFFGKNPSGEKFVYFINAFNALSFKEQGRVAKQLGLSREECLDLATTGYIPRLGSELLTPIVQSPYTEIGFSLKAQEKLNVPPEMMQLPVISKKNKLELPIIGSPNFNFFFEMGGSKEEPSVFERSNELLSGWLGVDPASSKIENYYAAIEIPKSGEEPYLSNGAIYLRQAELFAKAALHPETTVFLGFEGLELGKPLSLIDTAQKAAALLKAGEWIVSKRNTAQKELGQDAAPKEVEERVAELQLEDIRGRLQKMNRLKLKVENSIITNTPCIMIRGTANSDEARSGFYFYSDGLPLTVPIPANARPKENPNPFAHTSGDLLGDIGAKRLENPGLGVSAGQGYIGSLPSELFLTAQAEPRSDFTQIELSQLYALNGLDPTATMARLFETLIGYPHLLDHEIARRRFTQVFFTHLLPYINANDFTHYNTQFDDLASLLNKFVKDEQYHRAAFLLFLVDSLKKAARATEQTKDIKDFYRKLPRLTDYWDTLQKASGTSQERAVAVYLLNAIDEQFIKKATATQLNQVLQAWEAFQTPGGLDFSPHLAFIVRDKMEISILPTLIKTVEKNPALKREVNLSILDKGKERKAKSKESIPIEVKREPLYKKLLGKSDPKAKIVAVGTKIDCQWTEGARHFHLIFDPTKQKDIDRIAISFKEGTKEYFYSPASTGKGTSIAGIIERQGVWTAKENGVITDILVLLKQPFEYQPQESIHTSSQTLKLIVKNHEIEQIWTGDNQRVCPDEKGSLSEEFAFLPKERTFFITNENGKGIKEVRLIGAPFHFVHQNGQWRVSDKPDWQCHFIEEDSIEKELGESYSECILVLSKGYQKEYRIFPKLLLSIPVRGESVLEFDTNTLSGPLSITQNFQGVRTGSHAAFFYMAYLALAQGRTASALEWLKLAEKNGIQDEKDTDLLKNLLSSLSSLPASTSRLQACHLKFELTLRKVLKEKYSTSEFEDPEIFHIQADRLIALYRDYEKTLSTPANAEILKAEGLLLSNEEADYFSALRDESIRKILDLWPVMPKRPTKQLEVLKMPREPSDRFFQYLIALMEPPSVSSISEQIRNEGIRPNAKTVLTQFWAIWTLIQVSQYKIEDLLPLFGEIEPSGDPELDQAVDEARRILLGLAMKAQQSGIQSINPPLVASPLANHEMFNQMAMLPSESGVTGPFALLAAKRLAEIKQKCTKIIDPLCKELQGAPLQIEKGKRGAEVTFEEERLKLKYLHQKIEQLPLEEQTIYLPVVEKLAALDPNREYPLRELLMAMLELDAPVTKLRYEAKLTRQIEKLKGDKAPMPALAEADFTIGKWPVETIDVNPFCKKYSAQEKAELRNKILLNRDTALQNFQDQPVDPNDETAAMRIEQNRRIKEGINNAADQRLQELDEFPLEITKANIEDLQSEVLRVVRKMNKEMGVLQTKILEIASDQSENLELGHLSLEAAKESAPVIMQRLLDLYQDGEIKGKIPDSAANELEKLITEFLLLGAPVQMLIQAYSDPNLPSLSDLANLEETNPEWQIISTEVLKKIKLATKPRYLGSSGPKNGKLVNPEKQRPYLVLEHRAGYVLSEEQMTRVQSLEEDPYALEELRMGLGKSTVIFPMLARFIARTKQFPVVLFTEELIGQSRADMDRRAYEFAFDRSRNLDPSLLKQEYLTLLEVRKSHRYVMTTVDRLASLDNKIIELHSVLSNMSKQIKELEKKGPKLEEQKNMLEAEKLKIKEQLKWLKKISSIFDDKNTRFIADETDEIFNISSEKNYSEGKLQNVNSIVLQAGEKIFDVLAKSPESKDFLGLIQKDHQTTLAPKELEDELLKIARKIASDTNYWDERGWNRNLIGVLDKEQFAKYLIGAGKKPEHLPTWPKSHDPAELRRFQAVDAMRHWFIKTLPAILKKRSGIDYDLSRENGHSIVPKKEGRPLAGVKFGEEYELIGYAFLSALRKPIKETVFKLIYPELKKNLQNQPWLQPLLPTTSMDLEAEAEVVYKQLEQKDRVIEREKLTIFLFQNTPLENVFAKQIRRNVQDVARKRKTAGVSGTMNTFALPHQFHPKGSTKYRSTTGDLLMRLSRMGQGMSEALGTFDDPLTQIKELCNDFEYKAIINLGTVIGDKTTKETIEELRKSPGGKKRQFIFVDFVPVSPDSLKLKKVEMIWNPGEDHPRPFDKRRDAAKVDPKICLYYFSPADTRGTDFRIPQGTAALIAGPTNDLSEWEQAAYRCRKLGVGQKMKMFVERAFANKLPTQTVKDLVLAIRNQTIAREGLANYKYISTDPLAILRSHLEKILFDPEIEDETMLVEGFDAVEHLFIQDKTTKFGRDYDPEEKEDSLLFLGKAIDDQIDAATELKKKISTASVFQKALDDAIFELKNRKAEVTKDWEEKFKPNLPTKLSKAVSVDTGAQAQVQQQQMQQQQTQTQQQRQQMQESTVADKLRPSNKFKGLGEVFLIEGIVDEGDMDQFSLKELFPNCGLDDVYASTTMLSLLDNMATTGTMSAHIGSFIASDKKLRSILLSSLSQDMTVAKIVEQNHDMKIDPDLQATLNAKAVYSIQQGREPGLQTSILWPPENFDESEWKLQVAKLKLVMGMSELPDEEKQVLKKWFISLDSKTQQNLIVKLESRSSAQATKMLQQFIAV